MYSPLLFSWSFSCFTVFRCWLVCIQYPRVTLHWDPVCLDVTEECIKDIRKVRNNQSLRNFYNKYGDLFACRVQLGGVLSCSEAKHADSDSSSKDQASKFKALAQASISGSFAQASAKASHEKQEKKTNENNTQNLNVNMAWVATGGDTLLCNKLRLAYLLLFNTYISRHGINWRRYIYIALLNGAQLSVFTPTGGLSR